MTTVVRLRDAPSKKLKITITREAIDRAVRADSKSCMIAEAVKEQFPEAKHVSVDIQTVRVTDGLTGLRHTYLTPRKAQRAIIAFDQGEQIEPWSMWLCDAQVTKSMSTKTFVKDARASLGNETGVAVTGRSTRGPGDVRRVNGKTPPQMKRERKFGLANLVA